LSSVWLVSNIIHWTTCITLWFTGWYGWKSSQTRGGV